MTLQNRPALRIVTLALALLVSTATLAGGDWNDANIDWKPHDEGLELAKQTGKPVCIVVYTDWCPHCTNYSQVFHDPAVVEKSKQFVMVRMNKTHEPEKSGRYAPDGQYIPRTYFLSSEGKLDPEIHAPRNRYLYFYNEKDPKSLLGGMEEALKKLKS